MVVTIDNNITTYEYGKNCVVKIRKIYKDGCYKYLFSYGFRNSIIPQYSVWSSNLPLYYRGLIGLAFNYIGFDRNFEEKDIKSLVCSIRNYCKRVKI